MKQQAVAAAGVEKLNYWKKKDGWKHDTQVVISPIADDSFVILKKNHRNISIVSPFVLYDDDTYQSDFIVPDWILHRVQNFYMNVRKISAYTITQDAVMLDCLRGLPGSFFPPEAGCGWIHFEYSENIEKKIDENSKETIEKVDYWADCKACYEKIEPVEMVFEQPSRINFKPDGLKVFPVIFTKGFALAVADERKQKATLWVTINDINKMLCGLVPQYEIANLINNVFRLWPLFNAAVNEKITHLSLKNVNGLKPFLIKTGLQKAMLKFEYDFNNTKNCTVKIIGCSTTK